MGSPSWLVDLDQVHSSHLVLLLLTGLAILVVVLLRVGVVGWAVGLLGSVVRGAIRGGFRVWERLLSWASWPVFATAALALVGLAWAAGGFVPGLRAVCGLILLGTGTASCLAYMCVDLERYEVERGHKATHSPLKGQQLATHLALYGDRVGLPLLAAAGVGMVGGFALLNLGMYETVGRGWYRVGDATAEPGFADFLAYVLINLLGVVDVLDLAKSSSVLRVAIVTPADWPATSLLAAFKGFFTLVLLQQIFASVRKGKLLAETVADFWSPHESIHQRARNALPQFGALAAGPLLRSLRAVPSLTKEQRDQMPEVLAVIGPHIIPALVRHLADPQEHMRAVAAAALGRLHARDAVPAIVPLVRDPSDLVRQSAAEALGLIGGTGAVRRGVRVGTRGGARPGWRPWRWGRTPAGPPPDPVALAVAALQTALGDDASAVRTAAARAVGRIGVPARPAAPNLHPLLTDPDETVRCQAAEALGHLGGEDETTVAALAGLLLDASAPVKAAAAQALAALKGATAPAVPALIPLLQDRDEGVRSAAAAAIAAVGPLSGAVTEGLAEGLSSPDTVVQAQTAEALGVIGEAAEDAVPALVEALKNGNDRVRGKAVEALGKIGEGAAEVALPGLIRALRDADDWVSGLAAEALGQMGESADDAAPALMRSLRHVNPQVRANAAEALGRLGAGTAGARAALERSARDEDGGVRARAVEALGTFGQPTAGARSAVRDGLRDPDPLVRAAAAEAVGRWGEPDDEEVSALLALLEDANDGVKVQVTRALPKAVGATPAVVDGLCRRLLEDDSPWVQMHAAQALGRLGSVAAASGGALLRAIRTADEGVREQAVRAVAMIQPPEAGEALAAALKDANADIRKVASGGWMKAREIRDVAVPGLVEALADPESQVRANAAHALARLEVLPADAVPLLVACATDPSDGVRVNAAAALRLSKSGAATAAMRQLVADPNPRVRLIAAGALLAEDSGDAGAGAALVEALDDPTPRVRALALKLVESLGTGGARFIEELTARRDREADEGVRADLARVLEQVRAATPGATDPPGG